MQIIRSRRQKGKICPLYSTIIHDNAKLTVYAESNTVYINIASLKHILQMATLTVNEYYTWCTMPDQNIFGGTPFSLNLCSTTRKILIHLRPVIEKIVEKYIIGRIEKECTFLSP